MAYVQGTSASEVLDQNDGVTDGRDYIEGYDGNDTIVALGGNDYIVGGNGADTIYGGDGFDAAGYGGSVAGVIVSLAGGFGIGGSASGDRLYGVENLFGSDHDDTLIGEDFANELFGGAGNDFLDGGAGADYLNGGQGNDTLIGGAGADNLDGGVGEDAMSGGAGDDIYYLVGNDTITELAGEGYDVVFSTAYAATLSDNLEVLSLLGEKCVYGTGNAQSNTIYGNKYDNILNGGAGADTLAGMEGNDRYFVDNILDQVVELNGNAAGYDIVFSSVNYTLSDNVEVLSLASGTAVYGTGNAQSNTIYGNAGDNVLNGAGGADALSGLGGNDNFVFHRGEAHGDTIYEFEGNGAGVGDFMYFIGYGTIAEGATFHQLTATDWQITSADGLIQDTITFAGGATIEAGDFVFI